ncbi:MAG: response regulator [Thermomicrobiales bacterium]
MTQERTDQKKILVLVDDLIFASRIEGTLGMFGYRVRIAPIASETAAIAREWEPDGIVVSFGAPFSQWEGAIRAIRAEPSLAETPLLAFGPHVDTAGRAAAVAAGATRVVTNGVFFRRMPDVITALLGSSGQ